MAKRIRRWVQVLQRYADRWWYAPLIAFLACIDHFVIIIPTDGLLVSAVMLAPKRWIYTTIVITLGSSLGAWLLAAILETHGLPFLLWISPGLDQTSVWQWTNTLMDQWGGWALFLVAISPLMQHPAVALAAMAYMPLKEIFLIVFAGRLLKYGFLAWLSSHAPQYLSKLWGIQDELKEAGVEGTT